MSGWRMRDEISVFRSPLRWLRNGARGLVPIVHHKSAELLRRAHSLLAEDVAHGRELERITAVSAPRIMVPRPADLEIAA